MKYWDSFNLFSVSVTLNGLALHFSAKYHYQEHIWPHLPKGDGSIDLVMSNSAVTISAEMSMDADGKPQFAIRDGGCTADIKYDSFDVEGGTVAAIIKVNIYIHI